MLTLAGLFVYPIKSCRGTSVASAELTWSGLQHDREWMVVTPEGRFLTQRETPRLALVAPDLRSDALVVTAPGMEPLVLALDDRSGARREVVVWRDACEAIDAGEAAAGWFSAFLGRPLRLVRFDAARRRRTDPQWSGGLDGETRFTDGFPLLVLSRASFDDLNARLPAPLPLDRFRTSLLLDGCEPYAEDRMHELAAAEATIRIVKPCTRCVITTTDQATATRDGEEPLRTLRTYRWDAKLRGVAFAQNAIVASGAPAELHVGMPLHATWKSGSGPS
ncbi:MAG TPA: MOSC N-terminal beta barrel domain-containing protein [Steroidobacteraceae bacterium]|nr:MOSC N-terminal beta barrel domain-containing protein [Steroidobacteraceae bacterium]